ncbi:hypothetical protein [Rubripirellula reticaptiva]|uniref:Uncharacterized protein n=1 Tax=Rubripirellula reticaptiva TaxID=2528013 RepID=A0A5C6F7M0_9BACT|nr:hypothetical protein [Rubripirellula reticaptiva]TWU57388.1 hypothetical protein Poly59_02950 [Rubripirellula reticaptiva]
MHVIRLRKPWRKVGPDGIAIQIDVPEPVNESVPLESLRVGQSTRYERNFNSPTGLGANARVYLRVEAWDGDLASIQIGEEVATENFVGAKTEIDITEILRPSNTLVITLLSTQHSEPRLSGAVTIAIDDPS